MLAIERQKKICEWIEQTGVVGIGELTERFAVSIETIRRDLLELERQKKLTRVHGGAVKAAESKAYQKLAVRKEENLSGKVHLSEAAAQLIREGDSIMVDSGSTAVEFAHMLAQRFERLTVITHSLEVFEILREKESFTVYLCSGSYERDEKAFIGIWTVEMIQQFHARTAFLFPSALSVQYGIMDYHKELFEIQKTLMRQAERVVFLADSTKFEKNALLKVANMKDAYAIVTDEGLEDKIYELYRKENIPVIRGREEKESGTTGKGEHKSGT